MNTNTTKAELAFRYLWALPTIVWIIAAYRATPLGATYVALCLTIAALMPVAQHAINTLDRKETERRGKEEGQPRMSTTL